MVVGVIAELNPYHQGHQKLLDEISKKYKDSTIVMVLGGHFLQRGIPSVLDKWKKTEIALQHGVDLIVELPFPFATQSADIFAKGAIFLLKALQVDVLAFGTESEDVEGFQELVMAQKEDIFDALVQVFLRMGKNYPTALSCALEELTGKRFSLPNDLLAISYLKAMQDLDAPFEIFTVKRENHSHLLDTNLNLESASSIRRCLHEKSLPKGVLPKDVEELLPQNIVTQDDFFPYLRYKVLSTKYLEDILGVSPSLAKKLQETILEVDNYKELVEKLHTKNYTYNYLSRTLLHVLVNFTKEEAKQFELPSYIRILGFSKKGRCHLNQIKKSCTLPILSKFPKRKDELLKLEMRATQIYSLALSKKEQKLLLFKEFGQAPIQTER